MQHVIICTVIAIEGFVSIAAEILCMRQVSVFMGNSVLVSSLIIGVFLLALSYGYKRGSQYTSNLTATLAKNLLIASILLGVGLSYWFMFILFAMLEKTLHFNNIGTLLAYLSLVIAPLTYHLGQTLPITMNLISESQRAGAIGGKVLHLSALGSFLGAVSTTIIFMHFIGVSWTVIFNSALLMLAMLLVNGNKSNLLRMSSITAICFLTVGVVNYQDKKISPIPSNEYSNYIVFEDRLVEHNRRGSILAINHSPSSFAENGTLKGFSYIEKIKEILFVDLKLQNKNILVLGAGGFSLSAAGDFGNKFLYVDIDPNLKRVVDHKFIPIINGDFIASDARMFLRSNTTKFDVIVSDVYSNKTTIPAHLLTKEYFELLSNTLAPGGVAIFNFIINPLLQDQYSARLDNTIRASFSNCATTAMEYSGQRGNVLYVCAASQQKRSVAVYTDDTNSAALDVLLN